MSEPDDNETVIRQEPDDGKTTVRGKPEGNDEETVIRGRADSGDNEKTTVKSSAVPTLEPNDSETVIRSNASATILREPAGDNATILRSAETGNATILRGPSDEEGDDAATVLRGAEATRSRNEDYGDSDRTVIAGDGGDEDDDRTIINSDGDEDDATIIGNQEDTTYVANLESQEPKGNTEAGRLLKNRFVLEQKVGGGGMGDVYKALDLRLRDARERDPYIAIKLLNESFARHKDAFVSLQRETTRTRSIPHPNIMAVYDFDMEGDTVFMCMELLDGEPLDDFLKAHPEGVSHEDAWNILDGICGGLKRAHNAGIVHSDFKPGNIFYTKDKTAKVFDFGIARAISNPNEIEADGEKTVFDAGSLGALTPTYASYEMLKGMEPSKSDDVYAVALVAYELFMAKHPYDRTPADKAYEKGMKPERVPFLKRRQWKALEKALQLKGEDRTATLDEFHEAMFSEDPPYARYGALAAIVAISAGLTIWSAFFNEQIRPEELVGYESVVSRAKAELLERLTDKNVNFQSNDWHDAISTSLRRWKATDIIINENEEWRADWNVVTDSVDDPNRDDDIPSVERKILETYIARISSLNSVAALNDRDDKEEVQAALDLINEASSYMVRVQENYANIDIALVTTTAGSLDVASQLRHAKMEDILEQEELDRLADEERARIRAEQLAEEQRISARDSQYLAYTDDVKEILKCKGDIPSEVDPLDPGESVPKLTRLGTNISGMRDLHPERFRLDVDGIQTAMIGCIKRRIGFANPKRARDVLAVVAGYIPEATELPGLVIEDKDPCQARGLEGRGSQSRSFCVDPLSLGGIGPQLVVIPAKDSSSTAYAISRTEIKIGEYNQFCESTGCPRLAGDISIPATNLSVAQATAYMTWLSAQSGETYRLPTVDEWSFAAEGQPGDELDDNINCTVDSRGVRLGERLLNTLSGRPNGYGLYNHVGNAREWAIEPDGSLLAMGGAHTDPKSQCNLDMKVAHTGTSDSVTGFRVVRVIPKKQS